MYQGNKEMQKERVKDRLDTCTWRKWYVNFYVPEQC